MQFVEVGNKLELVQELVQLEVDNKVVVVVVGNNPLVVDMPWKMEN
jgi:hypothetical protein